jgi:tetratricopeptide (TPR) repeat protein
LAWRLGVLAAEQGQISVANAKLSEMKAILPEIEGKDKGFLTALGDLLQGEALLAQGDLDRALALSQKACGPGSSFWDQAYSWPFNLYTSYHMDLTARIYAKKGDVAKAISEYQRLLTLDVRTPYLVHPLYHYRLGLLYERAKDVAKAKAQYQKFLDLWKDADPGHREVEDAKWRLSALKSS